MWHNITRNYITWQAQMWEYKEIYNNEQYKSRLRVIKENSRAKQGGLEGQDFRQCSADPRSTTPLWCNRENLQASSSETWTWRIQGSQNSSTSGVVNAKWRATISTHLSINPNKRACIENRVMSTCTHEQERDIKWWDKQMWQNQLYGLSI